MFRLSEAAAAIGAILVGADVEVDSVTTDSRGTAAGDLFVALRGERFDGHQFVKGALAAGASAALVSDRAAAGAEASPLLVVDDTRAALGRLAAWWRGRFSLTVAGVTGSNGKTTVKEMLAAILRVHAGEDAVLATQGNLNNDIGLPLMLLRLRSQHRFAVLEMGMNHLGEIRYLSGLARPDVAVINNAGVAHIGELGSRENIARAKGEIFEGLVAGGVRVLNADDDFIDYWRSLPGNASVIEFSLDHVADVSATCELDDAGSLVALRLPDGTATARVNLPGRHNVRNALAAAAVAHALRVPVTTIAEGLGRYEGTKGRLQRKAGPGGSLLVDDTYNANPDSMTAAIAWLARSSGKRVFVMGDMGELGPDAAHWHAEVGRFAREQRIDRFLAFGEASAAAVSAFGPDARHFQDLDALVAAVDAECAPGTTVLVKGSRFMRMERVVAQLLHEETTAGSH
ncbi:MAG: UDP-N-acetylmuramoyl-tripeptide--D-alanyl-D-alanine ligase [Burkholderiales bacterium]